jgi:tetratricopeptide (TPR) repeat protein
MSFIAECSSGTIRPMSISPRQKRAGAILLGVLIVIASAVILYQIPDVRARLNWQAELASAYVRGVVDPVESLPTPRVVHQALDDDSPTALPILTATPEPTALQPSLTPTITLTPTAIPALATMTAPEWEKQTANNCGPATLALHLRMFGWKGKQGDIDAIIRPNDRDKNVNIDELQFFIRTHTGWLNAEYRVNGSAEILRRFVAAGIPVMIEESIILESNYANDDGWSGHYLLITGYNDELQVFITQDSYLGANRMAAYKDLDRSWRAFNRVYMVIYTSDQIETVRSIIGEDWDVETNRRKALELSRTETDQSPEKAYAWFNLGTNLVYFERYKEAADAFDQARKLGLPNRMLRYQFGPFIAYFRTNRTEELMTIVDYALRITDNSEEALLWQGWGFYRQGKKLEALQSFNKALAERPGYSDALYAIDFVQNN